MNKLQICIAISLFFACTLLGSSPVYSCLPGEEDIPTQNDQIKICQKFARSSSPKDYNKLKEVSEKNFSLIEITILERFGQNSQQAKEFQQIQSEAMDDFNKKKMTLQTLTDVYFRFVTLLGRDSQTAPNYMKDQEKDRKKAYKFFTPIPVLSQDGFAEMGTLCDLISSGYCYIGVPLAERVYFDDQMSNPQRFFEHDISHAIYFGEPDAFKSRTFEFLQKFDGYLLETARTPEEVGIINFIRFFVVHEHGGAFHHQKGYGLFQLHPSPTPPKFQISARILLKNAKIDPKDHHFYSLHRNFANDAVKKGLMQALEKEETTVIEFANMINRKIEALILQLGIE